MHRWDRRIEVEQVLGSSLRDREWEFLVEQNYIDRIEHGELATVQLVEVIRKLRHHWGGTPPLEPEAPPMTQPVNMSKAKRMERQQAISTMLAALAADLPDVIRFRTDVLDDQLVPWDQVEEWINDQRDADGPPTRYLSRVPIPPEAEVLRADPPYLCYTKPPMTIDFESPVPISIHVDTLAYTQPDDPWVHRVQVNGFGTLARLKAVTLQLTSSFGWTEAASVVFVLTGLTPAIPQIHVELAGKAPFTALSRIKLTIDPTMSVREVMRVYSEARSRMLGERRRHRNLDAKNTALAVFMTDRPADEPERESMEAWNETFPEWAYSEENAGNFRRDWRNAQKHLLDPDFEMVFI